jgi:hypothetical protein
MSGLSESCGGIDVDAYQRMIMVRAQDQDKKESEEEANTGFFGDEASEDESSNAPTETSASVYERLKQKIRANEYISPEQVEKFMGMRPSRRHASIRARPAPPPPAYEIVRLPTSRGTSRTSDVTFTGTRASSVFKRKLAVKLACVGCVVGIPKDKLEGDNTSGSRVDVGDEFELENDSIHDENDREQVENEEILVDDSLELQKGEPKRVSFLSELVESYNQKLPLHDDDTQHSIYDDVSSTDEIRLLGCLDSTERWLRLRDDASAYEYTTVGSFSTSASTNYPFSCGL